MYYYTIIFVQITFHPHMMSTPAPGSPGVQSFSGSGVQPYSSPGPGVQSYPTPGPVAQPYSSPSSQPSYSYQTQEQKYYFKFH